MSGRTRVTSLALLATLLALIAGPVMSVSAAPAAQAKWTVMVYMSGDNNLEDYIVKDLELELAALGSTPNVQVTALADRGPGYDTSRGDWQTHEAVSTRRRGCSPTRRSAVADWGERNMGDPDTLADFVEWSKANYPADRYALYFWGHGWGWHPDWTMEDDVVRRRRRPRTRRGQVGLPAARVHRCRRLRRLQHGPDRDHVAVERPRDRPHGLAGVREHGRHRVRRRPEPAERQPEHDRRPGRHRHEREHDLRDDVVGDGRRLAVHRAADRRQRLVDRPEERAADPETAITRGFQNAKSFWQAPTDKDLYDLAKQINAQVTDTNLKAKGTAVMNAVDAVVLHRRFTGRQIQHGPRDHDHRASRGRSRRTPTGPTTTPSTSP